MINRLLDTDKTRRSFNFEWDFYAHTENQKAYYDKEVFEFLKEEKSYFKDKLVLEMGCGAGRQTRALVDFCKNLVALDVSDNLANLPKKNNLNPVQGDIMNLPLKDGRFDFIYSRGVFHHTRDPKYAFDSAVRLLKKGGVLIFSVYPKRNMLFHYANSMMRFITIRLDHKFLFFLCRAAAPLVPLAYKIMNPRKKRPLEYWENVWLLFDWFSPQYQFHLSEKELDKWCEKHTVLIKNRGYRKLLK